MGQLIYNIKELVQTREHCDCPISGKDMSHLPLLHDAYLLIDNGLIVDFGTMKDCPQLSDYDTIDASGRIVLPTWCDSHTHLVYAGNRVSEFVDRIEGLSYEQIAKKGGGILNSARLLQRTSEEDLYQQAKVRLDQLISLGTGAIEIKSGYGLTPSAELKMLRTIKRLKNEYKIPIKTTFLAAHALPLDYKHRPKEYIDWMLSSCLPIIHDQGLADYIDVFCEKGYFSVDDMNTILIEAAKYGLRPKVHVNQFNAIGGVHAAVNHKAISVDHLEVLEPLDLEALSEGPTMPVALPACSFFLSIPYTPAKDIIEAGLPLAIASDFNPGSSPSGNMNLVVAMSCIKMRMTPAQAINAATINGAFAMELQDEVGSITIGKKANLMITKPMESYQEIPYSFGTNPIDQVLINGITTKDPSKHQSHDS